MTQPTTLTIELDWKGTLAAYKGTDPHTGDLVTEPVSFEDLVIERAAQIVATRAIHDETTGYKTLREKAREQIKETLAGRVEEAIEAELTKPRQPTNGFGEPKGEPVTLAEQISAQVQKILSTPTRANSYSNEKAVTPVERVIHEATHQEIKKQVRAAVDGARDTVVARVTAEAASVLTEGMKRAVQL